MWLEGFPSRTSRRQGGGMMKGRHVMDNRGKRQAASIFGGMGFYIALLVCVVAAGVVGYFALLKDDPSPWKTPFPAPSPSRSPPRALSLPTRSPPVR